MRPTRPVQDSSPLSTVTWTTVRGAAAHSSYSSRKTSRSGLRPAQKIVISPYSSRWSRISWTSGRSGARPMPPPRITTRRPRSSSSGKPLPIGPAHADDVACLHLVQGVGDRADPLHGELDLPVRRAARRRPCRRAPRRRRWPRGSRTGPGRSGSGRWLSSGRQRKSLMPVARSRTSVSCGEVREEGVVDRGAHRAASATWARTSRMSMLTGHWTTQRPQPTQSAAPPSRAG